jgi:hypothetical protein
MMLRPKALEIQSANLKGTVEINRRKQSKRRRKDFTRWFIARGESMIRIGASESIIFNLRYLCYLLFQSAADFAVNGKSGMELSLTRSAAFHL